MQDMRGRLTVGIILGATGRLLAARPLPAFVTLVLMSALGVATDMAITDQGSYAATNFGFSIALFVAQFQVIDRLIAAEGLGGRHRDRPRVGAFVLLTIGIGLAIALGMFLLIIPGLLLYARWAVAVPFVIGEHSSAGEATAASAEMTRQDIAPLMIALAILLLPVILLFLFVLTFEPGPMGTEETQLAGSIALNVLPFGTQILAWYASVAIYGLYRKSEPTLEEVFA